MSLLDRAVVTLLPAVPKRVVRKLSSRYIAGPGLADARQTVARLNAEGKLATVDVLGEEVQHEDEAAAITAEYVAALDAFEQDGLDANVSIKPTGLGLKLGYDLCKRNIETVIAAAEPTNRFVRIDMEDSTTTDDTLRLFRELRDEGHGRVGPVLQASLKRTVDDAASLAGASVRLCKGIYIEPESIQFRDDQAVRDSFMRALETLIDGGCYAAIATHDEWLVDESLRLLRERALAPTATSSRCCSASVRSWATGSSPQGTGCGSTSPSADSGTSTRSGGYRRTRRSPATWPAICRAPGHSAPVPPASDAPGTRAVLTCLATSTEEVGRARRPLPRPRSCGEERRPSSCGRGRPPRHTRCAAGSRPSSTRTASR